MVAFNFSPEFVDQVEAGQKTQTIRRTCLATPGDALQLFTGQRTAQCRKLVTPDPVCKAVQAVTIGPGGIFIDGKPLPQRDYLRFARETGFRGMDEMKKWYADRYPELGGVMKGYLFKW